MLSRRQILSGAPAAAAAAVVNPDAAGALVGHWRALERQRRAAAVELRAARVDAPVRNGAHRSRRASGRIPALREV